MTSRKQTPDILADVLTNAAPEIDMSLTPQAASPSAARKAAAPRPKRPAAPTEPQPASAPKTMQYQVVSFQEYHGWHARYIDGQEIRNWERSLLVHEYIAYMADEGWKLASACSGQALYGHADKYQLFFKKQV